MDKDELIHKKMYEEDAYYVDDIDDQDLCEEEEYQELEQRQKELLSLLEKGDYSVEPYIYSGELCHEFVIMPGFNRPSLFWDFDDSELPCILVNVDVIVDGHTFMYDHLSEEWVDDEDGCIIEEVDDWLTTNINTTYSGEQLIRLAIPDEKTAREYIGRMDYYDIDGKLYFYCPEEKADISYTDEKRREDEQLKSKAKKLTRKEATKRFFEGDYEIEPLFKVQ